MALSFEILYHSKVVTDDIVSLPKLWRNKIRLAIKEKLTTAPDFYGRPLRRSLKGYRKLRVGDYRVVFRINKNKVYVLAIMHRSVVYKKVPKRL
ncbi:MAG: addiction module antitoxin RelB [Candidatus Zambryskibacteria bacterium CG11_big_fil_rev_8_21_14_0_20_42_18]|uniref:Type II toxin-antitoxin system RelE/ParE family toxin n=1 Tax=Candidatus Zambryskibacteria bacterium CG_4_9_14_3_um_filter_42_15 TaxID=1975112 RepID=A0A2M7WRE6_9BACT|nr:MAG: addiction module antitoxin RelB [Candidatus Zambryskibacteria bacterium CG11_big_fil_rev_8_21_14_0_20_42_18]PJA32582.1 MAG: type II toxin-antitoxin system RelE/ParE family toxin [Candidatus Zambryskibacteria bacterium CG_4_9_14_3_um_filter_42_15]